VEDNGSGFEYSPEATGFGILGMQKRARNVGSVLYVFSALGAGTQVRVKASLQEVRLWNRVLNLVKNRFKSLASIAGYR
jgi:glucose-6-phosphate-specific signal transduction histidine kinase